MGAAMQTLNSAKHKKAKRAFTQHTPFRLKRRSSGYIVVFAPCPRNDIKNGVDAVFCCGIKTIHPGELEYTARPPARLPA